MRVLLIILFIVLYKNTTGNFIPQRRDEPNGNNVFIISLDGFRWQELFAGADSLLINDPERVADTAVIKKMFWASSTNERRKKLMPFVWNIISEKGLLFGNRKFNNDVNVTNIYRFSYPGYNEILTGKPDLTIYSNDKKKNSNTTILEYLNGIKGLAGKVAAFTSWNLFSYILNKAESGLYINCTNTNNVTEPKPALFLNKPPVFYDDDKNTRNDLLTFSAAQQYISTKLPKVVYIGLGGTDEMAHQRKYGKYLMQAYTADRIISELWKTVQTNPFYKGKTSFIITTDHGRGSKKYNWNKHGFLVNGSSQTWMALIGAGIRSLGEIKSKGQLYQTQIAGTIGALLGVYSFRNYSIPVSFFEPIK